MTHRSAPPRHRRGPHRAHGFSLIELIITIVIAITVTGIALGALRTSLRVQREAEITNQIVRDLQLTMHLLAYDVGFAGVGVPRGIAKDAALSTATTAQLRPIVRVGTTSSFVFVGDLPYPNAELNGLMSIVGTDSGNDHRLLVASELCSCPPPTGAGNLGLCNCSTATLSGIPFVAADACYGSEEDRRSCPWGMNKWQRDSSNEAHMLIGTVDGGWRVRKWLADFSDSNSFRNIGNYRGLHMFHDYPASGAHTLVANEMTGGASGTAFISHPDRVFWSVEGNRIYRRQCWGAVFSGGSGPGDASWPSVGAAAPTTASTPLFCGNDDGTPWELVASNVETAQFRYFQQPSGSGAVGEQTVPLNAEGASRTRVVEFDVTLSKRVPGSDLMVRQRAIRRFWMENRGGITTNPATPPANGGCVDIDCRID